MHGATDRSAERLGSIFRCGVNCPEKKKKEKQTNEWNDGLARPPIIVAFRRNISLGIGSACGAVIKFTTDINIYVGKILGNLKWTQWWIPVNWIDRKPTDTTLRCWNPHELSQMKRNPKLAKWEVGTLNALNYSAKKRGSVISWRKLRPRCGDSSWNT